MTLVSQNKDFVLEAHEVSAGYGRAVVLRGVTIHVRPGSITGLLGPNGAGKTTLVRLLGGLLPATSGTIHLGGADVTREPPYKRSDRGLRVVPDGRGVFRDLTVHENLSLQVPRRDRQSAVDRVVATFPFLKDRLTAKAGSLSGGQQQMLALAHCYLGNPAVVVVDEISMGLAPLVVDDIYASLLRLRSEGVALLVVEQYVDRIFDVAQEVYIMQQGEIGLAGSPAAIDRTRVMQQYLGIDSRVASDSAALSSASSTKGSGTIVKDME